MGWRRWRGARSALPGQRWDAPPPFVWAVNPGVWTPAFNSPRPQWRGLPLARGQRFDPPWPTAAPAAPANPPSCQRQPTRRAPALPRRGRTWGAPPPFVWAVNPGTWTPAFNSPRPQWRGLPLARGQRFDPPWPTAAPAAPANPPSCQRQPTRRAPALPRRGRTWGAPPPFVWAVNPGTWTPAFNSPRPQWRGLPLARGQRFDPPWPTAAPAAPATLPSWQRQPTRRAPALPRRGRTWGAPPPFVWAVNPGVWTPAFNSPRPQWRGLPLARGQRFDPPWPTAAPAAPATLP